MGTPLYKAMKYGLLNGGKRIRPYIVCEFSKILKIPKISYQRLALAVELVHSYSLIHDDLPAMDDDALRRGKPTCHKEFGEDIAILAGDAIQPLAYSLITDCPSIEESKKVQLISLLTEACGWNGMVEGQILDISENICSIEELDEIKSESISLITMFHVIEHTRDPLKVINKLKKLLTPGGYLIIETPNIMSIDAKKFKNSFWGGFHFPRHWHLFSPFTINKLIASFGLNLFP